MVPERCFRGTWTVVKRCTNGLSRGFRNGISPDEREVVLLPKQGNVINLKIDLPDCGIDCELIQPATESEAGNVMFQPCGLFIANENGVIPGPGLDVRHFWSCGC